MRYFRKYGRRFARRVKRGARRVGRKSRVSKSVKRYVRRAIARRIENKEITWTPTGIRSTIVAQASAANLITNTFCLMPSISQGTGNGYRISDTINVKKIGVQLYLTNYELGLTGQVVRVVVFSVKDYNQDIMGTTLPSIEAGNFFRSGTTTASANGTLVNDHMLPINTNRITIHAQKKFVIGEAVLPQILTPNAQNALGTSPQYHKCYFSLGKKMKILKYDENGTNPNYPTNHNLFMAVLTNYADCTAGAGQSVLYGAVQVDFAYEDA